MSGAAHQWLRDGGVWYLYTNAPGQFSTCIASVWRNPRGKYLGSIKGGEPFEGRSPKALRLAINEHLGLFGAAKREVLA